MLVLTRQIGEMLRIGDDVSMTILDVQGNQVRIGVNAPKDIAIHREEIYQRIQTDIRSNPQQPALKKPHESNTAKHVITDALRYFSTEGSQKTLQKTPSITFKKKRSPLPD